MKILEVRDGFVKFEADKSICLSSFIQVDGISKSYIAQVIQLNGNIAYAKILFLNENGLQNYDKTLPSTDATIIECTNAILNNSINAEIPVIAGKTLGNSDNIKIDASAFDKKMLISVDEKKDNNIIVRNLVKQFNNLNKNVVIIDTLGIIEAKKYTAGSDFKLPLDTNSLAFMYEDCLNDATSDSKSLIVEIFRDLSEYSKTVPFVPFAALKTIVDDMVDKSHIFKLLVLKNKLAKFDKLGYFAKNQNEVDKIKSILNSKCSIIDLSKLDSAFQNRYLAFIYEVLGGMENTQVFLEVSNCVNKKNIKEILSNAETSTTFITHSKFQYLNDIKNVFDNFIIFPSLINNNVFNIYGKFLKSMPDSTYLLAGEATNYIPVVSSLEVINETIDLSVDKDYELEEVVETKTETPVEDVEEVEAAVGKVEETEQIQEEEEVQNIELTELEEENVSTVIQEPTSSTEDIIANIEEKSDNIISKAAESLEVPQNINMFSDEENEDEGGDETEAENLVDTDNQEINFETAVHPNIEVSQNDIEPDLEIEDYADYEEISVDETEPETEVIAETEDIEIEPAEETIPEISYEEPEILTEEEEVNNDEILIQDYDELSADTTENIETLDEELISDDISLNSDSSEQEIQINDNEELSIELGSDFNLDLEENSIEDSESSDVLILETQEENNQLEEINVLPISDDSYSFDEIVELDPSEAGDDDIIIDMEDEPEELSENIDEEIVKDVDKVFTTMKDDYISDSDLDFIDELNSDEDSILEEVSDAELEEISEQEDTGILEEYNDEPIQLQEETNEPEILETRNSSTPIVPVYDADIPQEDMVMSDPIQQGDTVVHAKYGNGVVEKMIKYGNKTLFSINFDNIGRRLLDPTLTEIKKS